MFALTNQPTGMLVCYSWLSERQNKYGRGSKGLPENTVSKTTGAYYCFQCTEGVVLTLGYCRWWWHCWITYKWSKSLIEMFDLSFVRLKLWSSTANFGFHQSKQIGLLFTTSRAGQRRGRPNLPRLSGTLRVLHLPASVPPTRSWLFSFLRLSLCAPPSQLLRVPAGEAGQRGV